VEGASCGVVKVDVSEAFWDTEEIFGWTSCTEAMHAQEG
jgi:hypothetical protein